MKKIDLQTTEKDFDYQGIYDASVIDFDSKIDKQPIAIKCGEDVYGSYGDFSCIVGSSKSMKTVLKNAIIASYKGGATNKYFDAFIGVKSEGKYILDLDTEQSDYHVKRNTVMIRRLVGSKFDNYKAFNLRKFSVEERLGFLKWLLLESEFSDNIGLCCLDGAADLVHSVNDELASYELAQTFMELTAESKCHLIAILHKNSQGGKPTGHLGSAILKKAETVMFLTKGADGYISAKPKYTRNKEFNEFEFKLLSNAMPKTKGIDVEGFGDEDDMPF